MLSLKKYLVRVCSCLLVLIFSLTLQVNADAGNLWQGSDGAYMGKNSSQYTNSTLQLKFLNKNLVLYHFRIMKGRESENISKEYNITGTFHIKDDSSGRNSFLINHKKVTLSFQKNGSKITVTENGNLDLPIEDTYIFFSKDIQVSPDTARELLEALPPVMTSLNRNNRPYRLEYLPEKQDSGFAIIAARHLKSNTIFARFLIANDLSKVYRQDDNKEKPIIIFGVEKQ